MLYQITISKTADNNDKLLKFVIHTIMQNEHFDWSFLRYKNDFARENKIKLTFCNKLNPEFGSIIISYFLLMSIIQNSNEMSDQSFLS